MPNSGTDDEKCLLAIHHWEPTEASRISQGRCSLWNHFHECSLKQCYGAPGCVYTYSPGILFSSIALVHTTVIAPSGPCVSWLPCLCFLQSAVCSQLDQGVTLLHPFSRTWPQWFSWLPFLLCISSCQTTFPLPLSGADVWGPSASSARHLFGVICPPTAFALLVGKVFVSFIFIFFCRCQELGTAQIAQDKRFVCFVHSFA